MIRPAVQRFKTKYVEPPKRRPLPDPLPQLPLTRVPIFRVDRTALESFIQQIFGLTFNWDVISQPGMTLEYNVSGRLDSPAKEDRAEHIRAGQRCSDLQLILDVLASDGLIPAGRYIIQSADSAPRSESESH